MGDESSRRPKGNLPECVRPLVIRLVIHLLAIVLIGGTVSRYESGWVRLLMAAAVVYLVGGAVWTIRSLHGVLRGPRRPRAD